MTQITLTLDDQQMKDLQDCAAERGVPVEFLIMAAVFDDLVR